MKIAWLHSHFLYSVGSARYIFEVSKRLAKNHDLTVFVEKSSDFWKEKFTREGIKIKEISFASSNSPIYWLFFPFFAFWEIMILKRKLKSFDLVITSIFPMNWFSLYLNKPNIFLCFEPYSFFYNKNLINKLPLHKKFFIKLLAKIYSRFDYLGTKKTTRILALNKGRSDLISKIYQRRPDGITEIAVDSNFFKPVQDEKLMEKYLGKKIILHSTDFTTPKGTHYLIEALPQIINEIPETKLLITSTVENAVEKKRLEEMIHKLSLEKNVEFLSLIEEKLLPVYYTLADVTAFVADPKNPVSKASLIVLESLACQTPVVCSVGQLAGMVDKKTGYFVDPRDTYDLAEKIKKILKDDKIRKRMGIFGRNLVLRKYRWENVVDSFKKQINIVFRFNRAKKNMDKVKFFAKKFILNPRIRAIFHFFFIGYFFFSLLVLFSPIANWLAILFFVEPKLQKTDAIVVLSASSYPDGTLTLFTLGREIEGILLYKEGWAKNIIFVGSSGVNKTPDALKMKELAVKLGVPEKNIFTGPQSLNTHDNLREAQEVMKKENLKNALLVTSSIHTKRSLLVAKKLGLEIFPASSSVDKYRQVSVDRLVLFWSEIREIMATVYYKFKGWI